MKTMFNLHKLSLNLVLISTVAFGSSVWACEKPQVSGYDFVLCLSEGLAIVKQNDKFGFVDKTGKVVIPIRYDDADSFSEGLTRVKQNDKWGFVDTTGKIVIPMQYDYAGYFIEGLAEVEQNGEIFYIDKTGKRID